MSLLGKAAKPAPSSHMADKIKTETIPIEEGTPLPESEGIMENETKDWAQFTRCGRSSL